MQRAFAPMKFQIILGDQALDRVNRLPKELREDCFARMKEAAEINAPLFSFLPTEWGDEKCSADIIAFNALADYDDDLVIIRCSFSPNDVGLNEFLLTSIGMVSRINEAVAGSSENPNPFPNQ